MLPDSPSSKNPESRRVTSPAPFQECRKSPNSGKNSAINRMGAGGRWEVGGGRWEEDERWWRALRFIRGKLR